MNYVYVVEYSEKYDNETTIDLFSTEEGAIHSIDSFINEGRRFKKVIPKNGSFIAMWVNPGADHTITLHRQEVMP